MLTIKDALFFRVVLGVIVVATPVLWGLLALATCEPWSARSLRRLAPLTPELRHPGADFIAHRRVFLFWDVSILLEYLWLISIEYILELSQLSPRVSVLHAHQLVCEYLVVSCELAPLDLTDQNTWMVLSEKATVRALDPILVRVEMEDHWLLQHAKLKTNEGSVVSDFVTIFAEATAKIIQMISWCNTYLLRNGHHRAQTIELVAVIINLVRPTSSTGSGVGKRLLEVGAVTPWMYYILVLYNY